MTRDEIDSKFIVPVPPPMHFKVVIDRLVVQHTSTRGATQTEPGWFDGIFGTVTGTNVVQEPEIFLTYVKPLLPLYMVSLH